MDKSEIMNQVTDIFREVLDDKTIVLSESTTASDVEGWDSLTHIQLVVGVEKHFKIRFTSRDIQNWTNVGQMADNILARQQ